MGKRTKLIWLATLGISGYTVWAFMAWFDASLRADLLKFTVGIVTGVITILVRDLSNE